LHEAINAETKQVAIKVFIDTVKIVTVDGSMTYLRLQNNDQKKRRRLIPINQSINQSDHDQIFKGNINSDNPKKEILLYRKRKA
jgi:hypothetical protein